MCLVEQHRRSSMNSEHCARRLFKVCTICNTASTLIETNHTDHASSILIALRKTADSLVMFVDLMGKESAMPCFGSGVSQVVNALRLRFQLQLSEAQAEVFVDTDLIDKSMGRYVFDHSFPVIFDLLMCICVPFLSYTLRLLLCILIHTCSCEYTFTYFADLSLPWERKQQYSYYTRMYDAFQYRTQGIY